MCLLTIYTRMRGLNWKKGKGKREGGKGGSASMMNNICRCNAHCMLRGWWIWQYKLRTICDQCSGRACTFGCSVWRLCESRCSAVSVFLCTFCLYVISVCTTISISRRLNSFDSLRATKDVEIEEIEWDSTLVLGGLPTTEVRYTTYPPATVAETMTAKEVKANSQTTVSYITLKDQMAYYATYCSSTYVARRGMTLAILWKSKYSGSLKRNK